MGYAGGTTAEPTYRAIGDHSETVEIDYDPDIISYVDLLEVFWQSHEPTYQSPTRQYANIVHCHGMHQYELASESARRYAEEYGRPVQTEIRSSGPFYLAEDYHQKYYLRNNPRWLNAFSSKYAEDQALIDSTLATRLNSCLAGYCDRRSLESELPGLGLTAEGARALLSLAR